MDMKINLGNNIKKYRDSIGLTQKQLAERIGFTEKSVSKWENGTGYPTLETLTKLSLIFGVSLDQLVYKRPYSFFYLGIDGGGTNTVFKLVNHNGDVKTVVTKGPSNPNDIGWNKSCQVLEEGIREICSGIPHSHVVMYAGISGGGFTGDYQERFSDFFRGFGFYKYENGSDVDNVLALIPNNPGVLVIMGTGFIVYAVNGTRNRRIAGWGQLFDEGGCGYTIGKDGIVAALRASDGSGQETVISKLMCQRLGEKTEDHLAQFYRGGKQYIASFSDVVFEAARLNDPIANEILNKNMMYVSQIINSASSNDIPVYFSGGITKHHEILFPLIQKTMKRNNPLILLDKEPIEGALIKARMQLQNR